MNEKHSFTEIHKATIYQRLTVVLGVMTMIQTGLAHEGSRHTGGKMGIVIGNCAFAMKLAGPGIPPASKRGKVST